MLKVSFIIPTLNRSQELKRLLDSFACQSLKPDEIIIVDQGCGLYNFTTLQLYNSLNIKYHNVDFKSLTKARNFGVKQATGDIVGFLDDDVVLGKDYVKNILLFFDEHPQARGVQGLITYFKVGHVEKVGGSKFIYKLYNLFAKVFLLNNSSSRNKLLMSGRNQYAYDVKDVQACQWLSGIGNYKREVFDEFSFDENLKSYALGEDKLFSYSIFKKYSDSLFVDPQIKCEHHHADSGRPKDEEWVKMKVQYTYYLWKKLFYSHGFLACLSFFLANLGDLLAVFFSVLLRQNRFKFWWWHVREYIKLL